MPAARVARHHVDVGPWMWVPVTVAAVAVAGTAGQAARLELTVRKQRLQRSRGLLRHQ